MLADSEYNQQIVPRVQRRGVLGKGADAVPRRSETLVKQPCVDISERANALVNHHGVNRMLRDNTSDMAYKNGNSLFSETRSFFLALHVKV